MNQQNDFEPNHRFSHLLTEQDAPENGGVENAQMTLRMEILELETEIAAVCLEMKNRMWASIEQVAQKDPVMGALLHERKSLDFQSSICGQSPEDAVAVANINASMVAGLKDFGGHEMYEELIETRANLRKELRKKTKQMEKLRKIPA